MAPKRKSKPRSPFHAALGEAIKQLIAENEKLDKKSVMWDAGFDIKQLNGLIRGTSNPNLSSLIRLANGLHVRIGKLMTLADELREQQLE